MTVRAVIKGLGLSAKRVRPLLNMVRGKGVQESLNTLRLMPGPVPIQVAGAIRSAAANAENNMSMAPARLKVVRAVADGGPMTKRTRAKARGRGGRVLRHSSQITIEVDEEQS
jgi:large subunit ribosomal protein L22